ncbi:Pre-mRNA-splicing factor ATP-dependent RNA helicase PRP43 [Paramyrothecium foliicola]|nr:Pre-mRNA-splicing factor ATP-dependent RNA helicase PRP43 [Paramyrothecium foliicola]
MAAIKRNEATVEKIQALEDAAVNPLNGQQWPQGHNEMLAGRRRLPVYGRLDEILDVYHKNQVFVLTSETGSGKSTQIPQAIMHDEYASGLRVACTQPRRLAATELAGRVAEEMGVTLGEEVGYQIGNNPMVDKNEKKSRLVYMTDGVLLGQQAGDQDLSRYAGIIIDEAHERTVETDLLMPVLKKIIKRRKDFKIIIMSATVDAGLFQKYFDNCPVFAIQGRNFEVEIRYLRHGSQSADFTFTVANVVLHIHRQHKPGGILVFLPGQNEICRVSDLIREHADDIDVWPLFSALPGGQQHLALNNTGPNRKCILSTNIAETSLTIDDIVYVVDCGLSRQMIYNPRLNMDMLRVLPITQASANQRSGRAGRTKPGTCYRLYSKATMDSLPKSNQPAIRTSRFHTAALRILRTGHRNLLDYDYIEPPHPESVARAEQDLREWGYIADDGDREGILVKPGVLAARCPLDPIWLKAIQEGVKFGCASEMIDIAVLCSTQKSIFLRPAQFAQAADLIRQNLTSYPSDHIALLNAYHAYSLAYNKSTKDKNFNLDAWCSSMFLSRDALEDADKTREAVGGFAKDVMRIPATRALTTNPVAICKALARTFYTQTAFCKNDGLYRTIPEHVCVLLGPYCSVRGLNNPWIVYTKLTMSGRKLLVEIATAVDPEWLVDLPLFQEDRLPQTQKRGYRQPEVKASLDAARARIAASKN